MVEISGIEPLTS